MTFSGGGGPDELLVGSADSGAASEYNALCNGMKGKAGITFTFASMIWASRRRLAGLVLANLELEGPQTRRFAFWANTNQARIGMLQNDLLSSVQNNALVVH